MTDEQLQELSGLATKAISVGAWSAYGPALIGVNADDPKGEEEAIDIVPECFESDAPLRFYTNCQYIAAACNAVPALIADYRRLRDLERAVRGWFTWSGVDGHLYAPSPTFATPQEEEARAAIGRLLEGER